MAALLGPYLNYAAFCRCQHEGRIDGAGTALMVCRTFSLVESCQMNHTKGNGLTADNSQPAKLDTKNTAHFTGTDNPRHLRVIHALLSRPRRREDIDSIAGCSNGPELIAELRRRGLGETHLPCERIRFIDRDGYPCRPGVYSLTEQGRRAIYTWLAKCRKGPTT